MNNEFCETKKKCGSGFLECICGENNFLFILIIAVVLLLCFCNNDNTKNVF
ncbi:MAG: hypothetical protein RSE00_05690 [Clostridia bacterium]